MEQEQYRETWDRLSNECHELEEKRDGLETDLSEVKSQIAHLEQVLNHLRPLAGLAVDDDISDLGITEAIRVVLKNSKSRMSASDVRLALKAKGFDLSTYSAPMSSIYKVLGRLADDSSGPVVREKDGNGVFYLWRSATASFDQRPPAAAAGDPDDYVQSAEISDDDIPF
jgi:uncharacterized protein YhaN